MKIITYFNFLLSIVLGERFLQSQNRKILITYDQMKESYLIFNIYDPLVKRIARESCQNRGLLTSESQSFKTERYKRHVVHVLKPLKPPPQMHTGIRINEYMVKYATQAGKVLFFKMTHELNKAVNYVVNHPIETAWTAYLVYQAGSALKQQFQQKKEIITLTKGETLLINLTRAEEIERKKEGTTREAFNQIFTLNRLSPIIINTNELTEYIMDEQIDDDVNLYDFISVQVTGCFENENLDTFGVILSVEIPQFRVFNATSEMDIGLATQNTYSYLKLDKNIINELNVNYVVDLKKCTKSKMYVCPSSSLKSSQCNIQSIEQCDAEVILLNQTDCGITSIRQDIDFGHILIANTKEITENIHNKHRTIKIPPNTPVQLRIQQSSTFNVCGRIIKPVSHRINLTTLKYPEYQMDEITEMERRKIEQLLQTINIQSEDEYFDSAGKNILLLLSALAVLCLIFVCCSSLFTICYFLKRKLLF